MPFVTARLAALWTLGGVVVAVMWFAAFPLLRGRATSNSESHLRRVSFGFGVMLLMLVGASWAV